MRPHSIVQFERFYLISLLLVLVQQVIGFFFAQSMFSRFAESPEFTSAASDTFTGFIIVSVLFGVLMAVGVPLLFWWLAARKRQEFAKWVLMVISVLSVLNWLLSLLVLAVLPAEMMNQVGGGAMGTMQIAIAVTDAVAEGLGILALTYLFRDEATAWFRNINPGASANIFS